MSPRHRPGRAEGDARNEYPVVPCGNRAAATRVRFYLTTEWTTKVSGRDESAMPYDVQDNCPGLLRRETRNGCDGEESK